MKYVYELVILVIWTGICAVLVRGLELVLEVFGYKPQPVAENAPPRLPDDDQT
jgi:hypothetical protein